MPEYDSFRNILRDAYAEGCRRCEADLWEFVQPLNGWIDELLERPSPDDWRRLLDDYLAEQVPKGYTLEPYSLPLLLKHIESRARRHGLLPEQQAEAAPSPAESDHGLSPFVITVIPNVSGPGESGAPSDGQGAILVDGVEVAGPGPTVTESYKAKVKEALDLLDPRIGNWWKANSVQGQIRSRDARFWQSSYYTKLEANDQPFIYVDQSFTAGQTAQAIIAEVTAGWFATSIGAFYKKYRFAQTGDFKEFRAWQQGAAGEAARLASVMAELYVGSVATLSPAGDLVVTMGDVADNGLRWGQLLSVLPFLGHLPFAAIVFKIGKRNVKLPKKIARGLERLTEKERKAILVEAAAAKSDDEATDIIKREVARHVGDRQVHHAISATVYDALQEHRILRGKYQLRDKRFESLAIDYDAHHGWQAWHRDLDEEVATWIRRNRDATEAKFEAWLRWRYSQPDVKARIPNGP